MPTVHIVIKGKVQGVFFRATAKDVADAIGVKGWVKNTEEGNVEAIASGNEEQIRKFIAWCKIGPRRAVVTDVVVTDAEEKDFRRFEVVRE